MPRGFRLPLVAPSSIFLGFTVKNLTALPPLTVPVASGWEHLAFGSLESWLVGPQPLSCVDRQTP